MTMATMMIVVIVSCLLFAAVHANPVAAEEKVCYSTNILSLYQKLKKKKKIHLNQFVGCLYCVLTQSSVAAEAIRISRTINFHWKKESKKERQKERK